MESGTTPQYREMTLKRLVPLGRYTTIGEIGEAVSFLASDRAATITGQMLAVDGGLLTGFGEDFRAVVRKRMEEMEKEMQAFVEYVRKELLERPTEASEHIQNALVRVAPPILIRAKKSDER